MTKSAFNMAPTALNRMASTASNRMAPTASNRMAPTALNEMAPTASNVNLYNLCKIVSFPYKSKEPKKLTHMSCFFSLKGLIWSLWPAFSLKGLIWFLQTKLGLKGLIWSLGPKLNLQGFIKSPWIWLASTSSPHFRIDLVSTSLSTFDKWRLWSMVSNYIRAQNPNPLYIWA